MPLLKFQPSYKVNIRVIKPIRLQSTQNAIKHIHIYFLLSSKYKGTGVSLCGRLSFLVTQQSDKGVPTFHNKITLPSSKLNWLKLEGRLLILKKSKTCRTPHFGGKCCLHFHILNKPCDRSRRQYRSKQQTSSTGVLTYFPKYFVWWWEYFVWC